MDLGLGHLTELKAHLLNEALRSDTRFDTAIAALGRGVAARFESHCNRKFARVVGDLFVAPADRDLVCLDRYPVESISKVELRESLSAGYVDQGTVNTLVENISAESGLVKLYERLSAYTHARLRLTHTGGYWYATAAARVVQRGTVAIPSGGSAAAVAFGTAFDAIPAVVVNVIAPDGGTILAGMAVDITEHGFTAQLSAPTAASGYSVAWTAVDPAGSESETTDVQSGSEAVSLAAESLAVEFPEAFSAAPVVHCNLVGPEGAVLVLAEPSLVTTDGFTAVFGAPLPAGDYELAWIALAADADSIAATTLPTGATALPYDLKQAWLLQCEYVWKLRDKLGTSVGGGGDGGTQLLGLSLAGMKLIPDVEATLDQYKRRALL